MLKRLEFVDKNKVWNWVRSLDNELVNERWNGRINSSGRKCIWFGVGVDLGFNCRFFEGKKISDSLRKRNNELWGGDDWNSILVYKYEKGVELKEHIDRDCFDKKVVLINVSNDDLFGGNVKFCYGGNIEVLSNGEIIEFDNRVKHGVKMVDDERWSISIRKVLI